jgi:hypothetical protein
MEQRGLRPATVNGLRGTLHTVFSRARKARVWSGSNPISDVERRRNPKKIRATLAAVEVSLVLFHVPDNWRDVFATAIYPGCVRANCSASGGRMWTYATASSLC